MDDPEEKLDKNISWKLKKDAFNFSHQSDLPFNRVTTGYGPLPFEAHFIP